MKDPTRKPTCRWTCRLCKKNHDDFGEVLDCEKRCAKELENLTTKEKK